MLSIFWTVGKKCLHLLLLTIHNTEMLPTSTTAYTQGMSTFSPKSNLREKYSMQSYNLPLPKQFFSLPYAIVDTYHHYHGYVSMSEQDLIFSPKSF